MRVFSLYLGCLVEPFLLYLAHLPKTLRPIFVSLHRALGRHQNTWGSEVQYGCDHCIS